MTWLPGNTNCVAIYRLEVAILVCFGRRPSLINLSEWCYLLSLTSVYSLNESSCDWQPNSVLHHFFTVLRTVESWKCYKYLSRSLVLLQWSQTNCKHDPTLVNECCTNTVLPFLETAALFSHVLQRKCL